MSPANHKRIHGSYKGAPQFDPVRRVWYGAPDWAKAVGISVGDRVIRTLFRLGDSIVYTPKPAPPTAFEDAVDLIIRSIERDDSLWINADSLLENLDPSLDGFPVMQAAVEILKSRMSQARDMDELIAFVSADYPDEAPVAECWRYAAENPWKG